MNNNFGYTFGVPRSEEAGSSSSEQNSQSYSIDLSKITPPTFRFGQFGQIGPNGVSEEINDTAETGDNGDNDSFLADPSISIGQFDASFSQNNFETPPSETSSISNVPILVEELVEQPDFLEEPAAHSVEELLKATIDGDTKEVLMESWENVGMEEILSAEVAEAEAKSGVETSGSGSGSGSDSDSEIVIDRIAATYTTENEPTVTEPTEATAEITEPAETNNTTNDTEATETKAKKPKAVKAKPIKATTAKVAKPPVEVVGKRQRKTVERFTDKIQPPVKTVPEKSVQISKGTGIKLGEIEIINQNLTKKLASDKTVIMLHKVIFDRNGEARSRKSNLRSFCGIEESQTTFESKLQKLTNAELKDLTEILGLTGGNEKAALASKISNFLVKPSVGACKSGGETKKKVAAKKAAVAALKAKAAAPPVRSSKRANPATTSKVSKPSKPRKPRKLSKEAKLEVLTPEFIDSDVESDVEREVLDELKKGEGKKQTN